MKLRTWRKQQRLTLKELKQRLPKKVRCSVSTLSRLELGELQRPDPSLCRYLERLTGNEVTLNDLVP